MPMFTALALAAAPSLPIEYPGISSFIIPRIKPEYFADCLAGITASPGDSIAGTMSPAPLGPGTDTTPLAYFFGLAAVPLAPGTEGVPTSLDCAVTAREYAAASLSTALDSTLNV